MNGSMVMSNIHPVNGLGYEDKNVENFTYPLNTSLEDVISGGRDVDNFTHPPILSLSVCDPQIWYMCVTYVLSMFHLVLGIVANCILCFQIIRAKSYHSPTFTCILVLSISDISASISMIATIVHFNMRIISVSSISQIFELVDRNILIAMVTTNIWSNENTVLFALERYYLMKNPIKYARLQTPRRIFLKSFICLISTGVLNVLVIFLLVQLVCKRMDAHCIMPYFGALGTIFWVVTLILLVVIHRAKIKRLRQTDMGTELHIHRTTSRMTRSVYAILIAYFITNGPLLIIDILKFMEMFCTFSWSANGPLIFNICFFFNSLKFTANPFIYFFCSKKPCKICVYSKRKLHVNTH
ncbi:uncharacterized protein LOC111105782 [Crassostrea virginica]